MLKYSVIVPMNYNDGTPIPEDMIQNFEFEVMTITGGITRDGITEGKWLDSNRKTYLDKGIKFIILVEEKSLERLINTVKRHMRGFGQIAFYREIDRNVDADIEMVD